MWRFTLFHESIILYISVASIEFVPVSKLGVAASGVGNNPGISDCCGGVPLESTIVFVCGILS